MTIAQSDDDCTTFFAQHKTANWNRYQSPGGKKVVDQLAKDDWLWVLEEVQHRKKWLMVQPWRQGGQGYVIADAVRIDNATNPVGAGNSPPLAPKSDEMPAPPKPTQMSVLKALPEPLDAWEIAIAAAFVILALLLVWIW